jgi:uncharacterized protein YceH (UPF0502 family)
MAVLLLRGPQTVGEIRGRTDRLFEFAGLGEVQETLDKLSHRDEPLVLRLERLPGQKDARYAHLLSGKVDLSEVSHARDTRSTVGQSDRMANLEQEVERISSELESLRQEFARFQQQFD